MNKDAFVNDYGFDLNNYLLSSLTKVNRKNLEDIVFQVFSFNDASKVMTEITEGYYSGFYDQLNPKKSREFKEKYGRLSNFQDAYLSYFLNEYYIMMNKHIQLKTIGSDVHRYKFLGHDVAVKLKNKYCEQFGMTPFFFVSRKLPKERHQAGHFPMLNGVSIAWLNEVFVTDLTMFSDQKKSSFELNERRKQQIRWIKHFLEESGCLHNYSLISNGIWEGFYEHSFHEIKELFEKNNVSASRLTNDLDFELLSYRVAMMDTMINILQNHFVNIPDLLVVFSREIGRLAKVHFMEKNKVYPYSYLQNCYFGTDQLSLFDDETSIKINDRRS